MYVCVCVCVRACFQGASSLSLFFTQQEQEQGKTRLDMKASYAALAAAAALALLAGVEGTCLLQCTADLILPGNCQIPSNWPFGQGLTKYVIECETCCSAPGGPLNCSPTDPLSLTFEVGGQTRRRRRRRRSRQGVRSLLACLLACDVNCLCGVSRPCS